MGLVDELVGNVLRAASSALFRSAVETPVLGLLVRYRANYTPRGGQLLEDGHAQRRARDEPGPPASFWRVFVRTRQVEGWLGLYKGFFPVALTSLLIPLAQYPATHLVVLLEPSSRGLGADETEPSVAAIARYILALLLISPLLSALLLLPMQILVYRAITTPHHIPFLAPKTALHTLLSPSERRRPYLLYLSSGLVASNAALVLCAALISLPAYLVVALLVDTRGRARLADTLRDHLALLLVLLAAAVLISVLVLTPLRLARVRLALQRHQGAVEGSKLSSPERSHAALDPRNSLAVALRSAPENGDLHQPYRSLVDCLRIITLEEGRRVLWRGWWAVLLQMLLFPTTTAMSNNLGLFTVLW